MHKQGDTKAGRYVQSVAAGPGADVDLRAEWGMRRTTPHSPDGGSALLLLRWKRRRWEEPSLIILSTSACRCKGETMCMGLRRRKGVH